MKILFSIFFFVIAVSGFAQNSSDSTLKETGLPLTIDSIETFTPIETAPAFLGLKENKDEKIDLLIQDYIENKKYHGYRIQIFSSSNNKWEAVKVKSAFISHFPEIKSYLVYQAPNFKVRVGDYLDRLEVHEVLEKVRVEFPTAFIVKGEVEMER